MKRRRFVAVSRSLHRQGNRRPNSAIGISVVGWLSYDNSYLHNLELLYSSSVWHMWTTTQID
jgi:hypothetical protein